MKKILAAVVLLTSTIVGIATAWPFVEPYLAAHRGYVRYVSDEHQKRDVLAQNKVERVLHHIQIEQADGKKEAVDNDLFKAQLELKKAQEPATQEFIANQINKLQATKERLVDQINTLNKSRP